LSVTAVLVLHAAAFQVAVVTALDLGAYLVFGMPVGVLVDRWRRRPVLIAAELVRAAAILSIPLVYLAGGLNIWQVMVVAAFVSTAGVFFNTAHTTILPSLVGRDQVSEANARLQTSDTTMRVVGPALAGQILRITTGPILYAATAVMSLVSAGLITTIKVAETTPAKGLGSSGRHDTLNFGSWGVLRTGPVQSSARSRTRWTRGLGPAKPEF